MWMMSHTFIYFVNFIFAKACTGVILGNGDLQTRRMLLRKTCSTEFQEWLEYFHMFISVYLEWSCNNRGYIGATLLLLRIFLKMDKELVAYFVVNWGRGPHVFFTTFDLYPQFKTSGFLTHSAILLLLVCNRKCLYSRLLITCVLSLSSPRWSIMLPIQYS